MTGNWLLLFEKADFYNFRLFAVNVNILETYIHISTCNERNTCIGTLLRWLVHYNSPLTMSHATTTLQLNFSNAWKVYLYGKSASILKTCFSRGSTILVQFSRLLLLVWSDNVSLSSNYYLVRLDILVY